MKIPRNAHHLMIGRTGMGKSTWLCRMLKRPLERGRRAVGLNPKPDRGIARVLELECRDVDHLVEVAGASTGLELVVDDALVFRGRAEKAFSELACLCRDRGHRLWLTAHLWTSTPPHVRAACSAVWAFQTLGSDAKKLAAELGAPGMLKAVHLPEFRCLLTVTGTGEVEELPT